MIALSCARCGRSVRCAVYDASRVRCSACGFEAAPPPEVGARLSAAFATLRAIDVRRRQLSSSQRRMVDLLGTFRWLYLLILGLLALPFGGCSVFAAVMTEPGTRAYMTTLFSTPLIVFVVFGAIGFAWLRARSRRLENGCAATAPVVPGEPAACRVCGGPIAATGAEAFARCGFCGADNLVAPDVVARVGTRQATTLDRLEADVVREASASDRVGWFAILSLPLLAVIAPVLTIVALSVLLFYVVTIEQPVDRGITYTVADVNGRSCIAQYRADLPPVERVSFSSAVPKDSIPKIAHPEKLVLVDASWFVGKRVARWDDPARAGKVLSAYAAPLIIEANYLHIRWDAGGDDRMEMMSGLCLHAP